MEAVRTRLISGKDYCEGKGKGVDRAALFICGHRGVFTWYFKNSSRNTEKRQEVMPMSGVSSVKTAQAERRALNRHNLRIAAGCRRHPLPGRVALQQPQKQQVPTRLKPQKWVPG